MKLKSLLLTSLLILGAGVANAKIYECSFDPKQSRGWAPQKVWIDTQNKVAHHWGEQTKYTGDTSKLYWNMLTKASNNSRVRVQFQLSLKPNKISWITIDVTGHQREKSSGKCVDYKG